MRRVQEIHARGAIEALRLEVRLGREPEELQSQKKSLIRRFWESNKTSLLRLSPES
jgi:hypothetical protein